MSLKIHYLDHAAATPLDERVFLAMQPYLKEDFYNPSSSYAGGRRVRGALEKARTNIAGLLGAKPVDIIFTAGATESIHMALVGVLSEGGHAVIGATEHVAVRSAAEAYPHSIAASDSRGLVTAEAVRAAMKDDTVLISLALADSEFGTVQPIAEIARLVETEREKRQLAGNRTPLYLHSDGSQAVNTLNLKVSRLGVDMLSLNAAKCYGPKQVGLLWLKSPIQLKPFLTGGGQERGLRSGTENVAGAVGFAMALELAQKGARHENERLNRLRDDLKKRLQTALPELIFDGHPKHCLPGHIHIHLADLDAERVVFHLDNEGVYVATGAACAANKSTRSSALTAIGLTPEEADGSLRITLGHMNDIADMPVVADKIINAIRVERGL